MLRFAIALPSFSGFAENVSRFRRFWHKFAVVNGFWSHIGTYLHAFSSTELLTWPFRKRFLRSINFIVHNRKFVPKREGNGHVHDRVHRIIPGCGRYRLCGNGVAAKKPLSRKQTPTSRKAVVGEAAFGALHSRRRKRPPWLLCSEDRALCAFGVGWLQADVRLDVEMWPLVKARLRTRVRLPARGRL